MNAKTAKALRKRATIVAARMQTTIDDAWASRPWWRRLVDKLKKRTCPTVNEKHIYNQMRRNVK
jgi:hypothetical protein